MVWDRHAHTPPKIVIDILPVAYTVHAPLCKSGLCERFKARAFGLVGARVQRLQNASMQMKHPTHPVRPVSYIGEVNSETPKMSFEKKRFTRLHWNLLALLIRSVGMVGLSCVYVLCNNQSARTPIGKHSTAERSCTGTGAGQKARMMSTMGIRRSPQYRPPASKRRACVSQTSWPAQPLLGGMSGTGRDRTKRARERERDKSGHCCCID